MYKSQEGPIQEFSWGRIIVNGKVHSKSTNGDITGAGKDIRIVAGKASEWKERSGHLLKANMVTGIFKENVEVLIIGNGVYGSLKCPETVKNFIRENGVGKLIIEKSPDACKIYNEFYRRGEKVALLIHGTC